MTRRGEEQEWATTELRNSLRSIEWDLEDLEDTVQVNIMRMTMLTVMSMVTAMTILIILINALIRLWRRTQASSGSTPQSWRFAETSYRRPGRR